MNRLLSLYSRYLLYPWLDPYWEQSIIFIHVLKSLICLASQLCDKAANLNNELQSWELVFCVSCCLNTSFLVIRTLYWNPILVNNGDPFHLLLALLWTIVRSEEMVTTTFKLNTDLQLLYVFCESFGFRHCTEDCRQARTEHKLPSLTRTFENFVN